MQTQIFSSLLAVVVLFTLQAALLSNGAYANFNETSGSGYGEMPLNSSGFDATLTGGGTICANTCTDGITNIDIGLTGGAEPYSIDLLINGIALPTFSFDLSQSSLQFCHIDTGVLPSIDSGPDGIQVTIPAAIWGIVGSNLDVQIVSVTDGNGCAANITGGNVSLALVFGPSLVLNQLPDVCNDVGVINLNDFLMTSETGQWSIEPTLDATGGVVFATGGIPRTYVATFTIDNPVANCISEVSSSFNIIQAPIVEHSGPVTVCNSPAPTASHIIDLNEFIITNETGFWTAPPEYNGGVIDDVTSVDFTGVPVGSYDFTFTTSSAVPPCIDLAVNLNVTVIDCVCPEVIFSIPPPICLNNLDPIYLNDFIVSSVGAAIGTWSFLSGPSNGNVSANGEVNPFSFSEGHYTFSYDYDMPVPGCPPSATLTISFVDIPLAELLSNAVACNIELPNGEHCVNFPNLIFNETHPGSWTQPSNYPTPITDYTNVCFDGFQIGEDFDFIYTIADTGNVCPAFVKNVVVTVIDCEPSSVDDHNNDYDIQLSPNPVSDFLRFNSKKEIRSAEYLIYGVNSKIVAKGKMASSQNGIDVSELQAGVYYLQCHFKNDIVVIPFVVF